MSIHTKVPFFHPYYWSFAPSQACPNLGLLMSESCTVFSCVGFNRLFTLDHLKNNFQCHIHKNYPLQGCLKKILSSSGVTTQHYLHETFLLRATFPGRPCWNATTWVNWVVLWGQYGQATYASSQRPWLNMRPSSFLLASTLFLRSSKFLHLGTSLRKCKWYSKLRKSAWTL